MSPKPNPYAPPTSGHDELFSRWIVGLAIVVVPCAAYTFGSAAWPLPNAYCGRREARRRDRDARDQRPCERRLAAGEHHHPVASCVVPGRRSRARRGAATLVEAQLAGDRGWRRALRRGEGRRRCLHAGRHHGRPIELHGFGLRRGRRFGAPVDPREGEHRREGDPLVGARFPSAWVAPSLRARPVPRSHPPMRTAGEHPASPLAWALCALRRPGRVAAPGSPFTGASSTRGCRAHAQHASTSSSASSSASAACPGMLAVEAPPAEFSDPQPDGADPDGADPDDPDGADPDGADPDDPDGADPDGADPHRFSRSRWEQTRREGRGRQSSEKASKADACAHRDARANVCNQSGTTTLASDAGTGHNGGPVAICRILLRSARSRRRIWWPAGREVPGARSVPREPAPRCRRPLAQRAARRASAGLNVSMLAAVPARW
jgi:hypothetical protein